MNDWAGVRERVLALADAPGSNEIFGASGHGFALDAPLTAAEVAAVETWLGVELPEDYRSFLLQVGAGGAGPAYGVFPVRRDPSGGWHLVGDSPEEIRPAQLAEAFPGGDDPAAVAAVLVDRPGPDDFADLADLDAALDAWEERLAGTGYDPRATPGALCLCDEGCGLTVWLAVTGPERGRMWSDARSDGVDLYPASDAQGAPLAFSDWYLGWLTAAEARCASGG